MSSALVVGGGIFGSALADRLVADGWDVTLVDSVEPGDPRSESGGETRMMRYSHGANGFYTELAYRSLALWRELGDGVLVEAGAVWLAHRDDGWVRAMSPATRVIGSLKNRLSAMETHPSAPALQVH